MSRMPRWLATFLTGEVDEAVVEESRERRDGRDRRDVRDRRNGHGRLRNKKWIYPGSLDS